MKPERNNPRSRFGMSIPPIYRSPQFRAMYRSSRAKAKTNEQKQRRRRYEKKGFGGRIMAVVLVLALLCGVVGVAAVTRALYPLRYKELVEQSCREFGVPETLVYAIIHTESGFDSNARSELGALGLMQIMPETFEWLQRKMKAGDEMAAEELLRPEINIRYGVYYLSILEGMFMDDTLAVAAYHAGQGRVQGWLRERLIPAEGCRAEDIPSKATGHYVRKVTRARKVYEKRLG